MKFSAKRTFAASFANNTIDDNKNLSQEEDETLEKKENATRCSNDEVEGTKKVEEKR